VIDWGKDGRQHYHRNRQAIEEQCGDQCGVFGFFGNLSIVRRLIRIHIIIPTRAAEKDPKPGRPMAARQYSLQTCNRREG